MTKILIFLVYILNFFNINELVHIECNYGILGLWAVGNKYRCSVENHLFIDSLEKAKIDSISGTHMNGKTNNDEIYFHIRSKAVQYLPQGLEKFLKNVTGIAVWYDLLKEIHQTDFKPFNNLESVNIFDSKIEIIEENIFDFNPNLVAVSLGKANIFHIGPIVFDHLTKLTSLHLGGNKCINEFKENNRAGVEQIIRNLKLNCISSDFLNFEKKLKIIENSENLTESLKNFELEFKSSKFVNYLTLNQKFLRLKNRKNGNLFLPTENDQIYVKKNESTTLTPMNCSKSNNWTNSYQNNSKIDDLHLKNFEILQQLRNLTEDIKASQVVMLSGLDQKLTACHKNFKPENETINEKFLQIENKLTTFYEKFEKLELNMNEIRIKLDSYRIEDIEKRMIQKFDTILQEKFDKLLKEFKSKN